MECAGKSEESNGQMKCVGENQVCGLDIPVASGGE
jgi:hypothetical protein